MKQPGIATVEQLAMFDEIIDVRSPAEYALDHLPGAINCPVLSNEERITVGTLYKQASPFEAKITGAALVARNIAGHIDNVFHDRPRQWQPLIYCWRGGNRSGAMAHILRQIGWRAQQLEGGYKAWRQYVLEQLEMLPARYHYRIICGPTGSGKSRLLTCLQAAGAQVLDLEALAAHRGSLLGNLPDAPQPSQKMFDSLIFDTLSRFDPASPVYVEAESKKIGNLQVPAPLLGCMRQSECLRIEAPLPARVTLLMDDYAHFLTAPDIIKERLAHLIELYGHDTIRRWHDLIDAGQWPALVAALLVEHYDPCYHRSSHQNYVGLAAAAVLPTQTLDAAALERLAEGCRRSESPQALVLPEGMN